MDACQQALIQKITKGWLANENASVEILYTSEGCVRRYVSDVVIHGVYHCNLQPSTPLYWEHMLPKFDNLPLAVIKSGRVLAMLV